MCHGLEYPAICPSWAHLQKLFLAFSPDPPAASEHLLHLYSVPLLSWGSPDVTKGFYRPSPIISHQNFEGRDIHRLKKFTILHGSLNVPIEHHPTIRYMVYNGYYKVMSNIPKMGQLPTPVLPVPTPKTESCGLCGGGGLLSCGLQLGAVADTMTQTATVCTALSRHGSMTKWIPTAKEIADFIVLDILVESQHV